MLKSLKIIIAVASLLGLSLVSLSDYARAGVPPPGNIDDCVDAVKDLCNEGQYKTCVDNCNSLQKKYRAECIVGCNLEVACCFQNFLFYSCGLGNDQLPGFCD